MLRRRFIQTGYGTAAEWTAANPVLHKGEFGSETDTGGVKVGNGVDAWTALAYITGGGGGGGTINFTDLADVPSGYTGDGGKLVAVKGTEDGLEFVPSSGVTDFTDLGDVPSSYSGQASKTVKVKGDESGLEFVTVTGGSGGSSSTSIGTYAALPAPGNAGDLYLCTDSPYLLRDNGVSWDHFFGGHKVIPPIDADFAWINQGSATKSTTSGGVYLFTPATAPNTLSIRKKAAPATPYTIEAGFLFNGVLFDFTQSGILFRQSSDGKLAAANVQSVSGFLRIQNTKYTNATSFSAHYSQAAQWPAHGQMIFMQISDNGTNRIMRVSLDAQNWIDYHTIGRTDFLTADEVGFFGQPAQSTFDHGTHLLHWRQF